MSSVLVIGYFNVLHAGHVRHLRALAEVGDVHIGIYNDVRNQQVHGVEAVPLLERIECLRGCKYVKEVVVVDNDLAAVNRIQPTHFGGHELDAVTAGELGLKGLVAAIEQPSRIPNGQEAKRPTPWLAF